jgi:hypothetical protein
LPPDPELLVLTKQLEELNRIGAALAAERDTSRLLELILTKARHITASDAGSLYVVEKTPISGSPPRRTRSRYAGCDSRSRRTTR